MITSRSGEKHRARAIEIGVDDYLGKPYQEAQLLDAIAPLVERHRAPQSSRKAPSSPKRASIKERRWLKEFKRSTAC